MSSTEKVETKITWLEKFFALWDDITPQDLARVKLKPLAKNEQLLFTLNPNLQRFFAAQRKFTDAVREEVENEKIRIESIELRAEHGTQIGLLNKCVQMHNRRIRVLSELFVDEILAQHPEMADHCFEIREGYKVVAIHQDDSHESPVNDFLEVLTMVIRHPNDEG